MEENKKIFIQIASYRDPELIPTLRDCIEKSDNPDNLVFSICWQHSKDDEWDNLDEFKDDSRFKIIDVDYTESKGACWARNTLQQQYDGEQYTLQLDSHHRFIKGWDTELINMLEDLRTKGHEKPLLTSYISSYNPETDPKGRTQVPWLMNFDRFIPEGAIFFLPATIPDWETRTEPIPARFYSAHFTFSLGSFVVEVPHDPEYYFHGEEISIAVRAYTHGYDLFHPHKIIAWHEYTRKGRTKQWDDDKSWHVKNTDSHLRNRKLFEMDGLEKDIDFGIYDFGTVRTLEDYERYAGVSFKKRAVQKYTLDNNFAPNPPLYGEELEQSFMSIFKHCIDLHRGGLKEDEDYDFWAVIFENDRGETINRTDANEAQIKGYLSTKDDFIKIWREFQVEEKPTKWIVWPHSKTNGWLEKLEGQL
jgi:glycosyltransferase involved in cell wall biosynthesis